MNTRGRALLDRAIRAASLLELSDVVLPIDLAKSIQTDHDKLARTFAELLYITSQHIDTNRSYMV